MELELSFQIMPDSHLVGMTLEELEKRYDIRIPHKYGIDADTKSIEDAMIFDRRAKINPGDYIKAVGEYKKVSSFGCETNKTENKN